MGEIKHTPWEVGQHPVISDGWIVRPVLFGSNVRVLPEWEGGHVLIRDEKVARLIAAAPEMKEALEEARTTLSVTRTNIMVEMKRSEGAAYRFEGVPEVLKARIDAIDAALAKVNGEAPQ